MGESRFGVGVRWVLVAGVAAIAGIGILAACGDGGESSGAAAGDGGESSGAAAGDGGESAVRDDGAALPPTKLGACQAYVDAYCERMVECGLASSTTSCHAFTALCPDFTFADGSPRTLEGVLACAAVRRAQPCGELAVGITPSCSPPGTRDAGAPCSFVAQCASFACDLQEQGQCGTCTPPSPDGTCRPGCVGPECTACAVNEECVGGLCRARVAVPDLAAGAACSSNTRAGVCAPPLRCRAATPGAAEGTCQPAGASGAPCAFDVLERATPCAAGHCAESGGAYRCADGLAAEGDRCGSDAECAEPLVCLNGERGARCTRPQADGAACNVATPCGRASYCAPATGSPASVCRPRIAIGQACSGRVADECQDHATCVTETGADGGLTPARCVVRGTAALGEACTTSSDCAASATCTSAHVCALVCE